jgi:membrane protein implicated in regulation of membrane protease activity
MLEETALAVIVLIGLPELGINLHVALLIVLMVVWMAIAILNYQAGSRALKKSPVVGLGTMIGSRGKVVKPLQPEGLIKVGSELWHAKSVDTSIENGSEVIVVGQDGKTLIVHYHS